MRQDRDESGKIREQARKSAVVLIQNWRARVRRRKIYRASLVTALMISFAVLTGSLYYQLDSSIPSVINVRAGEEESLQLGIPARAEIVSVSDQGASNIPEGAVDIDLSRPVTVKMASDATYQMQVRLFGFLPFKQVGIHVIEDQELIPVGVPIGIYVETEGVLVVGTGEFQGADGMSCSPGKNIVKSGDYVRKVNGVEIHEKEELIRMVEESGGEAVRLTVERNGEIMDLQIKPQRDVNNAYKIGVWVRDNAQGVGTMTYIDNLSLIHI